MKLNNVIVAALLLMPFSVLADSNVLSPFNDSVEILSYDSRFSPLTLLIGPLDDNNNPNTSVFEGSLESRIFKRPANVSDFEVYKSYLSNLESSGFKILLACAPENCNAKSSTTKIYWQPKNELVGRPYKRSHKNAQTRETQFLAGWAKYYISASKLIEGQTLYAMVIVSAQHSLYSIDELISSEMATNSVTLNLEVLKDKLSRDGRVVLEGLFFNTASSVLSEQSRPALDTVAEYLKTHKEQSFYVVGHTDDTGSLDGNLTLSRERARSVVTTLKTYGIKSARLSASGIGPYSPASTNSSDNGRELNRRVELVLRLN